MFLSCSFLGDFTISKPEYTVLGCLAIKPAAQIVYLALVVRQMLDDPIDRLHMSYPNLITYNSMIYLIQKKMKIINHMLVEMMMI